MIKIQESVEYHTKSSIHFSARTQLQIESSFCSTVVKQKEIIGCSDFLIRSEAGSCSASPLNGPKSSKSQNAIKRNRIAKKGLRPCKLTINTSNLTLDDLSPDSPPINKSRLQNDQKRVYSFSGIPTVNNAVNSFYESEEVRRQKREACKGISEIVPGKLYVGSFENLTCHSTLRQNNIRKVITAMSNIPDSFSLPSTVMDQNHTVITIKDRGSEDIAKYFEQVNQIIDSGSGATLIHCHSGISRSVTFCLAYLLKSGFCKSLNEAVNHMTEIRPISSPNLGFMGQLAKYSKTLDDNDSGIEL